MHAHTHIHNFTEVHALVYHEMCAATWKRMRNTGPVCSPLLPWQLLWLMRNSIKYMKTTILTHPHKYSIKDVSQVSQPGNVCIKCCEIRKTVTGTYEFM